MYRGEELYEHVASDNIVVAKYLVHVKQKPAQVIKLFFQTQKVLLSNKKFKKKIRKNIHLNNCF